MKSIVSIKCCARVVVGMCSLWFAGACVLAQPAPRAVTVADFNTLLSVNDPQMSPDGEWVAYTVKSIDEVKDESVTSLWIASWDGKQQIRLTHGTVSASSPRWSPDGRSIAFVRNAESEDEPQQIWLMDRRGGEASQLTNLRGDLQEYVWSPDSKRLALVQREESEEEAKRRTQSKDQHRPMPLVIDRYQFKSDGDGYHFRKEQPRIYLFDIASKAVTALSDVPTFAESNPAWSPDGKRIAFVSNRDVEWDRTENRDVWVADARAGATPRKLTTFEGADEGPLSWSPDGRKLAYVQGSEPKYWLYNYMQLAVVDVETGAVRLPTESLDRDISAPRFSADGRSIEFSVVDNRDEYLARISTTGGALQRLTTGGQIIHAATRSAQRADRTAVLRSESTSPSEIYALERGKLRALTHHNDGWRSSLQLTAAEDIGFKGTDGMDVYGLITKPPNWESGRKYPTILLIHGGPYGQDGYEFDFDRQVYAAAGYVVLQVNYRGSSGRGKVFGRGIFANWGTLDLTDLLAGVDYLVAQGIADPDRLGVGGWSQGGILTDYCIAHDQRFKAAVSGAGVANQLGIYGIDMYVYMYDLEFGQPWKETERWLKLSSPFFQADRIRTPTLFLGGDKDFNVPIAGGEQMYQALQSQKVPTQLVIYPGEHHGISRPSFKRDVYERYLGWFAKYLNVQK